MKKIHDYTPVGLAIALFLACLATAGCAVNGYYVSMGIALLLAAGCVGGIYTYMKRTSRLMKQFVRAVRYSEFPEAFAPKQLNGVSPELLVEMQEALSAYRNDLQKRESRLQYFRALAEHIDTAILVYTPDGALEWMNRSAARLVSSAIDESHSETYVLRAPKTLADLRYLHPELPERLRKLTPGQLDIVQIAHRGEEPTQLALSGMSFVLQGHRLLIASLKNIYSALDTQETESWQKLLRVLTHEIMNSLTPIVSLAELLDTQIEQMESLTEEKADMRQMLQTIARRGKSLTHFVNSYREVTHLPPPQLQLHNAADLLNDVARLMQASVSIRTACPPAPLRLIADKGQIEQVLINLVKNAVENNARHLTLSAGVTTGGRPYLRCEDDGTGIEPDVLQHIFVPFFTTKPNGSGIGLTLARQIMHRHHGSIDVQSTPGKGSTFTLLFPYPA